MSLSQAEIRRLEGEYDSLAQCLSAERKVLWSEKKESIIQFCIKEDILLYNIIALPSAPQFVDDLLSLFSEAVVASNSEKIKWKEKFNNEQQNSDRELVRLHQKHASVVEQCKTSVIPQDAVLTEKDLIDLLRHEEFQSPQVALANPFSLTECSLEQIEAIRQLVQEANAADKSVFLPVHHNNHWFYLLKSKDSWSVCDSLPALDNNLPTEAQKERIQTSRNFLSTINEHLELTFVTTGAQNTSYACGSHVVNAYRGLVRKNYTAKTHSDMITELFAQVETKKDESVSNPANPETSSQSSESANKVSNDDLDTLTKTIIDYTVSSQDSEEKTVKYKENLIELISGVVKQGLFAGINNKIALEQLNTAEAEAGESSEDFALRLQEAEFRRVGLSYSKK